MSRTKVAQTNAHVTQVLATYDERIVCKMHHSWGEILKRGNELLAFFCFGRVAWFLPLFWGVWFLLPTRAWTGLSTTVAFFSLSSGGSCLLRACFYASPASVCVYMCVCARARCVGDLFRSLLFSFLMLAPCSELFCYKISALSPAPPPFPTAAYQGRRPHKRCSSKCWWSSRQQWPQHSSKAR